MVIKSLYCQPEVCVRVNGQQSKLFHMSVGLRQHPCKITLIVTSPFHTLHKLDGKLSRTDECVTILLKSIKISQLLVADDLVLPSSCESGLQLALYDSAAISDIARKKNISSKT